MTEKIEALLDAGAVLPVGTDAVKDTIDTLTTRAYGHAVLGDRKVVRLVPRTLGQAEDLTMEFLGFTPPETVADSTPSPTCGALGKAKCRTSRR